MHSVEEFALLLLSNNNQTLITMNEYKIYAVLCKSYQVYNYIYNENTQWYVITLKYFWKIITCINNNKSIHVYVICFKACFHVHFIISITQNVLKRKVKYTQSCHNFQNGADVSKRPYTQKGTVCVKDKLKQLLNEQINIISLCIKYRLNRFFLPASYIVQ